MSSDAIARLRTAGETLPSKLRDEVLALGDAAVPELIAVLEEGDWAAVHAVDLLVDLRAAQAIQPLLDALYDGEWDDIMSNRIVVRLPELGSGVLEPALAQLADADEDVAPALCEILANLGVKDERIFVALTERFLEDSEDFWVGLLATYGDRRALPIIEDAIAAFEPDFSDTMSRVELRERLDAHERLGGVLPPELREEVDRWLDVWNARFSPARARSGKVGRNDPCPCGSGKKYKKCCIDAKGRSPAPPTIITRDGDRLLASGQVDSEQIATARSFFAEKDAGRGPAQQMVDYAQPLLDGTDGSGEQMQRVLHLGMFFWNAALMDAAEREAALTELADQYEGTLRDEFWGTARMMVERHRTMFPEMHTRAG